MKAVIVSNGELGDVNKLKNVLPTFDFVVCCDGGIRHLEDLALTPDLIVGDFDSVDPVLLDQYKKSGARIKTFPAVKDETDTELAAQATIEAGADQVILLGALGNRWDHSYANVMVLIKLQKQGIDAKIMHSHNQIIVSNNTLHFRGKPGSIISLLPLGENVVVHKTSGLKYKIEDKKMPMDTPYGISNILLNSQAEVQVASGWLMGVIAED